MCLAMWSGPLGKPKRKKARKQTQKLPVPPGLSVPLAGPHEGERGRCGSARVMFSRCLALPGALASIPGLPGFLSVLPRVRPIRSLTAACRLLVCWPPRAGAARHSFPQSARWHALLAWGQPGWGQGLHVSLSVKRHGAVRSRQRSVTNVEEPLPMLFQQRFRVVCPRSEARRPRLSLLWAPRPPEQGPWGGRGSSLWECWSKSGILGAT